MLHTNVTAWRTFQNVCHSIDDRTYDNINDNINVQKRQYKCPYMLNVTVTGFWKGDYGWGVRVALLAHARGVL